MANQSVRFWPETIRTVTAAQISAGTGGSGGPGTYIPIGAAVASSTNNVYAFIHPVRVSHIEDTTDVQLWFSLDGVNDHYTLVQNSFLLFDIGSNMSAMGGILELAAGNILYVRGNPSVGGVWLSVSYAK